MLDNFNVSVFRAILFHSYFNLFQFFIALQEFCMFCSTFFFTNL